MHRFLKNKFLSVVISFHVLLCTVANSQDLTAGKAALQAGKINEARSILEKAYKKNPADPFVKLAYAETAPCSTAIRLYKELSETDSINDSIQAVASCKLGDYNCTIKDFSKAVEHYRNAAKKGSNPIYRHYWAHASMALGDKDAAQSLWHTLSLEYGDQVSRMANYYLGLLQLKEGNYQRAHDYFAKTGDADPQYYWTIASLAGKLECASRMGETEKVKRYGELLQPFKKNLLEKELLELITVDTKGAEIKRDSSFISTSDSLNNSADLFTLQIGAFGSMENANNLRKKLSKDYKDITVVEAMLGEQVFYRVRIGTFRSKDDAMSYASDVLAKAGLSGSVVKK